MALVAVRVYEVEYTITSDDTPPGPAATYIDGGPIEGATEFAMDVGAVNPAGGEIAVDVEAAVEIAADVEGIMP